MPKRQDIQSILIIGAGPIVIGQACEFDYSGVQACKALREEGFRIGDHTVKFGGFVKVDAMASRYSGGDPANGDLLRDYHLPGSIPVGGAEEDTAMDFNARQTRFWLTTDGMFVLMAI